jgi:hypothetical protein
VPIAKVTLRLPFGLGGIDWKPDDVQRRTAWNIYVEFATRVATQPLTPDAGLDRSALKSLYALFGATRRILREAGPAAGLSRDTIGGLAIAVLNEGMRPFLSRWHAKLGPNEDIHNTGSAINAEFRSELQQLSLELHDYVEVLGIMAGAAD